jgi:hypothetical protein
MADLDFAQLTSHSLRDSDRLVSRTQQARLVGPDTSLGEFLDGLPRVLAADRLRSLSRSVVRARVKNKPVLLQFGGHMIKCGLGPLIIDLLKRGWVTALAINGSVAIHDFELAMIGETSEDVEETLKDGSFGMARETAEFINNAAIKGQQEGLGKALGTMIVEASLPYSSESVIAQAVLTRRPVTVHVAVGTDVVHQHATLDGAALGRATLHDFRTYCGVVADLGHGGVVINAGSAVILPEVFLKAVSVARNLGHTVSEFVAANLDMIQHYRTTVNVLSRPLQRGGQALALTGHHEILFPLLHAMVLHYASTGRS